MIFGILRVARMFGPPNMGGIDAKDVQKKPASGPIVAWIIVAMLALIVGLSMANHGQVVSLITPLAIVMGFLVLGGTFISGVLSTKSTSAKLESMPNPEDQLHRSAQLRQAISQRSAVAVMPPPVQAPPEPAPARPRPVPPHLPTTTRPKGRVTTRKALLSEADLNARMVRIAQIMLAECPACTAKDAVFCTFQPGQRVTVLDRERGIIVHDSRIGNALKTHTAKLEDVNAQFEGNIPDSVWKAAL